MTLTNHCWEEQVFQHILQPEIEADDHCSLLSSDLPIARLMMDIQNPEEIFNRMLRLSALPFFFAVVLSGLMLVEPFSMRKWRLIHHLSSVFSCYFIVRVDLQGL